MSSATQTTLRDLRRYESRNVTFIDPDGGWPIVWERANGVRVWDAEGRRYLDLTAAFGVAAAGHANPRVTRAGRQQLAKLTHAMGDVHPHALKARLCRELSRLTFERWSRGSGKRITGKTLFGSSGFEAVEAALKTARLATGRPGVIAFEGGYHGLGYGALNATERAHFREPFRDQLREFGHFLPFPDRDAERPVDLDALFARLERLIRREQPGAVLIEPVQARGGIRQPVDGFLRRLRELCDRRGLLLILDEIYTGLGRTGKWFACEHEKVLPDIVCLGKALTGGFPLSACVGRADVMDAAWPPASGEAIHTSTFLGHPVGCAMALAQIREIGERGLVDHSAALGRELRRWLISEAPDVEGWRFVPRGLGLMAGWELRHSDANRVADVGPVVIKRLLADGFIFLPEGPRAEVIAFTPPLTISPAQLHRSVKALAAVLKEVCAT